MMMINVSFNYSDILYSLSNNGSKDYIVDQNKLNKLIHFCSKIVGCIWTFRYDNTV